MLVFLIGFMGAGKTYVGKKVSALLGYEFTDLDAYIADKEERSIAEIFEQEGEAIFRQKEQQYLVGLFEKKNTVVATGGGTPCFFDNMEKMNEYGFTIYLFTPNHLLINRLEKEKQSRPLIKDLSDTDLRDYVTQKVSERSLFYDQAEAIFEVKTDNDSIINDIHLFLSFGNQSMM